MRLSASLSTSPGDHLAAADMVSRQLLGMPTTVTGSPRSRVGGVEVADRAFGERPVRSMEDLESDLRGAA